MSESLTTAAPPSTTRSCGVVWMSDCDRDDASAGIHIAEPGQHVEPAYSLPHDLANENLKSAEADDIFTTVCCALGGVE